MYQRYIIVEGDAYSRGVQIGKQLRPQIEINYLNQSRYYRDKEDFSYGKWGEMAKRYLPNLEKWTPEVLEEMQGMTEGSGLPFEYILALTTAYEKSFARDMVRGKCTSFLVSKAATYAQKVIVGQTNEEDNTEWLSALDTVIHHVDGENEALIYTHPGVTAYTGMNNCGLAILWEYIDNGAVGDGVPTNAIIRHVLNCRSIEEVLDFLENVPHDVPNEFGIADKSGRIFSVECFPNKVYVQESDSYLVHTNHIIVGTEEPEYTCSVATYDQYEVMEKQILDHYGNIDVEIGQNFLRSHERYPNCICAHPSAGRPWNQTLAGVVYDLTCGEMFTAFGCPCENEYQKNRFRKYLP